MYGWQLFKIYELLKKFDGQTFVDQLDGSKRKIKLLSKPAYLFLQVNRFSKNMFFKEKNSTIVNFPLQDLKLVEDDDQSYELVANVIHVGTA